MSEDTKEWKGNAPPPHRDFLLEMALYDKFDVNNNEWKWLQSLKVGAIQFDAHCIYCQKDSVFFCSSIISRGEMIAEATKPGIFTKDFFCTRAPTHVYTFAWAYRGQQVWKIGQNPSIEDIAAHDLAAFRKSMGPANFGELRRATGLFAHGIGIGSFVYLRRIFERLIHEYEAAQPVDDGGERPNRMDERILALKDVLPEVLVKNRKIYGILSKGIHELTEEECRAYFPVVRKAILVILQEHHRKAEEARTLKELDDEVAAISKRLESADGEGR
jgi:hypothetical protein